MGKKQSASGSVRWMEKWNPNKKLILTPIASSPSHSLCQTQTSKRAKCEYENYSVDCGNKNKVKYIATHTQRRERKIDGKKNAFILYERAMTSPKLQKFKVLSFLRLCARAAASFYSFPHKMTIRKKNVFLLFFLLQTLLP